MNHAHQSIKIKIALALILSIFLFGLFLVQYMPLGMSSIQANAFMVLNYLKDNPVFGTCLFIVLYFIANAVPMPFISVLTILAGYLFGTINALIMVSFASALGASCLFLVSRYLLKDWVSVFLNKKAPKLIKMTKKNHFWNAVSIRLIPGMPFCVPSVALSFTDMSLRKFYLSTQLGLLFILFVFVNAGSHLAQLESVGDIFNPQLIISMLLLALAPFLPNLIFNRFSTNELKGPLT